MKSAVASLLFLFASVGYIPAQESDCPQATLINNGVCISKNGKDCSKRESQSRICFAPDPQYTEAAAIGQVKGKVYLTAIVGTDGCTRNIRVVTPLATD
jgi:hypothetical protein